MVMSFHEKNGTNYNEMAESKMAAIESLKTSKDGFEVSFHLRNFPVSFVNALRRIVMANIPTVVLRDVQILENTTQLPHEMLKHRFEMLPVNVSPDDTATIREAMVELQIVANKEQKSVETITTDNFAIHSAREKILMRDRDLDTPILFLRVRPGEAVHIRGKLAVENEGVSQVCTIATGWHVDPELAKANRKIWVEEGKDPREFDNFYIQRSYSVDSKGRPNWFDFKIESVGVLKAKDILSMAVGILRKRLDDYMKEAVTYIRREQDEGSYTISLQQGGHTLGALLGEVIYSDQNTNFASYDIPHPLKPDMVIQMNTTKQPESILKTAREAIEEYCSVVEKGL
jgi:DNA-directed RNA polymerase subunit L